MNTKSVAIELQFTIPEMHQLWSVGCSCSGREQTDRMFPQGDIDPADMTGGSLLWFDGMAERKMFQAAYKGHHPERRCHMAWDANGDDFGATGYCVWLPDHDPDDLSEDIDKCLCEALDEDS